MRPNNDLWVHAISPIDFGWWKVPRVSQLLHDMMYRSDDVNEMSNLRRACDRARHAIEAHPYRSGPLSLGPCVVWLPPSEHGIEFVPAFVFKQQDNGTTFVVSPYPLEWLESEVMCYAAP